MPQSNRSKTKPRSIRFSDEEWSAIDAKRGHLSTSAFVRNCVLNKINKMRGGKKDNYAPSKTRAALAQILGLLGKSHAATSLRDLLDLARLGALPVSPEIEAKIATACDDIKSIKSMLIEALGLKKD